MDDKRFQQAVEAFDRINAEDPRREAGRPAELVYAERITDWVRKLEPQASETLLLAARCQHIKRWAIPRTDYPPGRSGYLKWRRALADFHADTAAKVLESVGCAEDTVARVRELNLKRRLHSDPEVQILEDALCLVFLEHQFADIAAKTSDDKMTDILKKTWAKMSPAGHRAAQALRLGEREAALLQRALGNP